MRRRPLRVSLAALFMVCMAGGALAAVDQSQVVPTLGSPARVLSLHRPTTEWKVVTTIVLKIEPTTHEATRTFKWSGPLHGLLACDGSEPTVHEVEKPTGTSSIVCTYQPQVGYEGEDAFRYTVRFDDGAFAEEAEVPIEIRERGFRWEFKSSGATVTSDSPDPEALKKIPDVIGGTSQDFLFSVNWQPLRPRTPLETKPDQSRLTLRLSEMGVRDILASRSANISLETGVQTEAVSATVVEVGQSATSGAIPVQPGSQSEEAVARRNLVLRGELNYNASLKADGVGRFVELGVLGRGGFSTVLDSDESFKEAVGRVLQIIPKDRSAYRFDGGARLAVKQPHELKTTTLVTPEGQLETPTNIENMFLIEVGYRFDTAVSALETNEAEGDSRHRVMLRAEFSPEITILPGHQLPTIGVEVSKPFAGGVPSVKVAYGVNLSASKGIFK